MSTFPLWAFIFLLCTLAQALLNFTIDDSVLDPQTDTSIQYYPSDAWNTETNCQGRPAPGFCAVRPDKDQVNGGTWHEATFDPSRKSGKTPVTAIVRFNGTAVYVFCVLTDHNGLMFSDMTFIIDGHVVGTFGRSATGLAPYEYNTLVYSNTLLTLGVHELNITSGRYGGQNATIILDKIVYSVETRVLLPSSTVEAPTVSHSSTHSSLVSSTNLTASSAPLTISAPKPTMNPPETINLPMTVTVPLAINTTVPLSHNTSQSHSTPLGIIIGAVIGSVAVVTLLGASVFFHRQRARRAANGGNDNSVCSPFRADNPTLTQRLIPARLQAMRWFIASDSKLSILQATTDSPPAYQ